MNESNSNGKRATIPEQIDLDPSEQSSRGADSNKRQNSSAYGPPESVPAYLLQFTNSIISNMSKTIGDQGYQAGEASLRLHYVEGELEKQRRLVLTEMAKTAAAQREVLELRRVAEEALAKIRDIGVNGTNMLLEEQLVAKEEEVRVANITLVYAVYTISRFQTHFTYHQFIEK